MRTTVVTLVGRTIYFVDMVKIANEYSLMGCIVNMRFDSLTTNKDEKELLDRVQQRKIEMSDIVHVVRFQDVDEISNSEIIYAKNIGKVITYVVPRQSYIDSFTFKDDNFIHGPLKWVQYTNGYQVSDINNKIVPIGKD